jgi:hypothetical protein
MPGKYTVTLAREKDAARRIVLEFLEKNPDVDGGKAT